RCWIPASPTPRRWSSRMTVNLDNRAAHDLAPAREGSAGAGRAGRLWAAARPVGRRPGMLLAGLFVLFVVVAAFAPGLFTSISPDATDGPAKLQPPGGAHWFGTDELGRDLFSRVVHGAGLTIERTLIAVGLAAAGGL